jgi:hypothetical protein
LCEPEVGLERRRADILEDEFDVENRRESHEVTRGGRIGLDSEALGREARRTLDMELSELIVVLDAATEGIEGLHRHADIVGLDEIVDAVDEDGGAGSRGSEEKAAQELPRGLAADEALPCEGSTFDDARQFVGGNPPA